MLTIQQYENNKKKNKTNWVLNTTNKAIILAGLVGLFIWVLQHINLSGYLMPNTFLYK